MSKSAPFRRRAKDAIDVAREGGFKVVKITTSDGSTYEFKLDDDTVAADAAASDDPIGDRLRQLKREKERRT